MGSFVETVKAVSMTQPEKMFNLVELLSKQFESNIKSYRFGWRSDLI